jgi:hypothetical protein
MPPILLDPRQVAEQLDATYEEVLSWTREGLVPSIRVSGRYYYDFRKVVQALHRRSDEFLPNKESQACG